MYLNIHSATYTNRKTTHCPTKSSFKRRHINGYNTIVWYKYRKISLHWNLPTQKPVRLSSDRLLCLVKLWNGCYLRRNEVLRGELTVEFQLKNGEAKIRWMKDEKPNATTTYTRTWLRPMPLSLSGYTNGKSPRSGSAQKVYEKWKWKKSWKNRQKIRKNAEKW